MVQVEVRRGEKENNGRAVRIVSDPFWAVKVKVVVSNNKKGVLENLKKIVSGKEEDEHEENFLTGERLFVVNGIDLAEAVERVKKYMEEEAKEGQILSFEVVMGWKVESSIAGNPITHIVIY